MALVLGCATTGHELDQTDMNKIRKGTTTRTQILRRLGPPEQEGRKPNGDLVFTYIYTSIYIYSEGVPKAETLILTFGQDDVVKEIVSTYGRKERDHEFSMIDPETKGDDIDIESYIELFKLFGDLIRGKNK